MIKIKNRKWQIFKSILTFLLIIFFINHYSIKNGYQEKIINEKTTLTEKNIKQFEVDLQNNKYIDIKNYNTKNKKNTNNTISKIGYKTSENINKIVTKSTKKIYKFLKELLS